MPQCCTDNPEICFDSFPRKQGCSRLISVCHHPRMFIYLLTGSSKQQGLAAIQRQTSDWNRPQAPGRGPGPWNPFVTNCGTPRPNRKWQAGTQVACRCAPDSASARFFWMDFTLLVNQFVLSGVLM